eukprot:scaffold1236_cov170-Ochromonas_danica.AAC.20
MTDGIAATTSHPSLSTQVNHLLQLLNDAIDPLEKESSPGSKRRRSYKEERDRLEALVEKYSSREESVTDNNRGGNSGNTSGNIGKSGSEERHRPWSQEDFLQRLRSFHAAVSLWFAKPDYLSPLRCARFGWRCAGRDRLHCLLCHATVTVPGATTGANTTSNTPLQEEEGKEAVATSSADHSSDSSRRRSGGGGREEGSWLSQSHSAGCPWQSEPCPSSFLSIPHPLPHLLLLSLSQRLLDFLQRVRRFAGREVFVEIPSSSSSSYSCGDKMRELRWKWIEALFEQAAGSSGSRAGGGGGGGRVAASVSLCSLPATLPASPQRLLADRDNQLFSVLPSVAGSSKEVVVGGGGVVALAWLAACCGWTASSSSSSSSSLTLACSLCGRTVNLEEKMKALPSSSSCYLTVEQEEEEALADFLLPLYQDSVAEGSQATSEGRQDQTVLTPPQGKRQRQEEEEEGKVWKIFEDHRHFCPWIRPSSSSSTAGDAAVTSSPCYYPSTLEEEEEEEVAGWELCLQVLQAYSLQQQQLLPLSLPLSVPLSLSDKRDDSIEKKTKLLQEEEEEGEGRRPLAVYKRITDLLFHFSQPLRRQQQQLPLPLPLPLKEEEVFSEV